MMEKPGSLNKIYLDVKNNLPNKVARSPIRRSAKIRAQNIVSLKKVEIDNTNLPPCVLELMTRVLNRDSIGFNGRNMLIAKMQYAGISNEHITSFFLQNGDPNRYGVLEPCPESENGYRLRENFDLITMGIHPRCDSVREFCSYAECRSSYARNHHNEDQHFQRLDAPSLDEYRRIAQSTLEKIFNAFFKE